MFIIKILKKILHKVNKSITVLKKKFNWFYFRERLSMTSLFQVKFQFIIMPILKNDK